MKSEKISEAIWRTIEETKALNYGLNAEETPNLQVTIRWTTITNSNNKNSNYNEDETNSLQCSAGKVVLHREEKYRICNAGARNHTILCCICTCNVHVSVVTVEKFNEGNKPSSSYFIYLVFFSFCCCSLLSLEILR